MMSNLTGPISSLADYYLLGRSGLRVSPLCLGTMTFGNPTGWGSEEATARAIFDRYLDAGGNFIDTADAYTGGQSEEMLGKFIRESGSRDRIVLATKFTFNAQDGNPNSGGNARKNIRRAVDASLKRLRTDFIDLYWLHAWDGVTPVEEVLSTLHALVQEGKIHNVGLSDVPAWYLARAQTLAEWRGYDPICALQLEYSLVERNIEREHIPAAIELGMGVCPWSPLASGFLTGKYKRSASGGEGEGRLKTLATSDNPVFHKFTERNWAVLDVLSDVAQEIDRSIPQVALNWITKRPGVVSTIIGATSLAQLESNLSALEFDIPSELAAKLEEVGRPEVIFPYTFFGPPIRNRIHGEMPVHRRPPWYTGE